VCIKDNPKNESNAEQVHGPKKAFHFSGYGYFAPIIVYGGVWQRVANLNALAGMVGHRVHAFLQQAIAVQYFATGALHYVLAGPLFAIPALLAKVFLYLFFPFHLYIGKGVFL
jgi:hypothetical protein